MATVASLIVQIGADIADLKRNTEKIDGTLGGIEKTAMSVGKTLAGAFTVGAISAWAMKAIDAAGRIDDLAKKLGVSTDAVQRWSHAATMGGSSIEDVDKAVAFMNKTLAGGAGSTVKALSDAGLKFDDIRKMKPEDAFETIAEAIAEIEDPMMRARVAMALFGKSGQELLPALSDGFRKVGSEADKMSGDTIAALAKAGDEIDRWTNWLTVTMGGSLAAISASWDNFWGKLTGPIKLLTGTLDKEVAESVAGVVKGLEKQTTTTMGTAASIAAANEALADFDKANKKNEDQLKKSNAAQDAYNESVREMASAMTGKKVADEVKKISDAIRAAGGVSRITAYEQEQLGKRMVGLREQGAALTPEMHQLWLQYERLHPTLRVVTAGQSGFLDVLNLVPGVALKAVEGLKPLPGAFAAAATVSPSEMLASFSKLPGWVQGIGTQAAKGFSLRFQEHMTKDLPQAIMGAIQGGGSVLSAAGSSIGSFLMSDKGIGTTIAKGAKALFGDKLGAAIGSALPGLGAMVGPLVSNLFGKLFGSAGRDSVKAFAESMGGFDALRQKLLPLGDVGEKLWVNLTQGVGKNNPEQAKAAIAAITKALQEQDAFIDGLVPSWQDSLALAEKYGIEVSGLGEKFEQSRLAEMANSIAVDFRKLVAAGADMNAVLVGMQDEVQDVITKSLQMGLDIPDSLKPVIQKMIEMGTLTDENGNKLTDMSKLNFSETLSKSVERIIDALDRLIETLGGGVKKAIDDLPKEVDIRVGWKVGSIPRPGDDMEYTQSFHNGGWIKAHNGMNRVLGAGEVPIIAQTGEAVLNRRAAARLGEAGVANLNGGGGGATVVDFSQVVSELRGQRADAKRAAAMSSVAGARAMRDALLLAR